MKPDEATQRQLDQLRSMTAAQTRKFLDDPAPVHPVIRAAAEKVAEQKP